MLRPGTFAMTALLATLSGLGPLTVDMYLASMPDIGRTLSATTAQVQLTVSFYLIGYAIGQVFYGPLSDRHGRRVIMMGALVVYTLASAACALAPSIELLIAARFCQAIGGAGTIVLARAVVRDLYEGARVGKEMSMVSAIMALSPIVAPLLGGVLQTLFGWRSNFVVLVLCGGAALGVVWLMFPETLRQRAPERVSPLSILRSYRIFLSRHSYLAHLGIATCCFLGLFAWISTAAFVLQDIYGLSPLAFGFTFAIGSAGYLIGTWIAARFVVHWGMDRTLGLGCLVMAAGGITFITVLALGVFLPFALVLSMSLYFAGMGLALPQAQAGALLPFPDRAGAASSLMGIVQQTTSAILGTILGHILASHAWPLAIAEASVGCLAVVIWALTRRVRTQV
jgi:DHA1 family bicyclomycin/chloramphenicol resistance-like MFS transporter